MTLKVGLLAVAATSQACPRVAATMTSPQATGPVTRPTLFPPVRRSMQQLIGGGFQVVNIAVGPGSSGDLPEQDTRHVTCAVQPDTVHPDMLLSECRAMN